MSLNIFSIFPKDQVLTPEDGKLYDEAIHRWAENAERKAKYVVLPRSAKDVSTAVRLSLFSRAYMQFTSSVKIKHAVDNNLEIAIKGGGHSCSGASSSEGLVIDMRHFSGVTVDAEKRLLTVGGGAIWETVDKEAAKYGLATVGGTVNHTGDVYPRCVVSITKHSFYHRCRWSDSRRRVWLVDSQVRSRH